MAGRSYAQDVFPFPGASVPTTFCLVVQVFVEVEKAMDSLTSQQGSKNSAQIGDHAATHAQGAGQLAAA